MSPIVKKKKEKEKIPGKYVLFILTVICILLIGLTFTSTMSEKVINNVFGAVVVPVQKGLSNVSGFFIEKNQDKKTLLELEAENKLLKDKINDLTDENTALSQDKYELTKLRELYELDSLYAEYDKVAARIISSDSSSWFSSFLIDKGTDDGIKVDMNVLAGNGLVGRVTETGKNWARVTSIISDESCVSGLVLHSQDNIIVEGNKQLANQQYIYYTNLVDKDNVVEKGDKVVTSNISDKYLPGILVGYISTVELDSNNMTKSGYITPVVDFSHLSEVLVITELKEKYEFTEK